MNTSYHENSKVCEMIAAAGDNPVLTDVGSASFARPALESEVPGDTAL